MQKQWAEHDDAVVDIHPKWRKAVKTVTNNNYSVLTIPLHAEMSRQSTCSS